MTPKEKAKEMYDAFHVYDWDIVAGYTTWDKGTKEMCCKVVDEVLNSKPSKPYGYTSTDGYWVEVKKEINKL